MEAGRRHGRPLNPRRDCRVGAAISVVAVAQPAKGTFSLNRTEPLDNSNMTLLLSLPVKCNVNWRHYPVFAFFALILRSIRNCSGMRCRPVLGTIARLSRQFNVPPPVAALVANASIPRFGMLPENFSPIAESDTGDLAFDQQVTANWLVSAAPHYLARHLIQPAAGSRVVMFGSISATARWFQ